MCLLFYLSSSNHYGICPAQVFFDLMQFRLSSYSNMSGQGPFPGKARDAPAVMASGDV